MSLDQPSKTLLIEGRSDVYLRLLNENDDQEFYEMIVSAGENMDRYQFWNEALSLESIQAGTQRSFERIDKGLMLPYRIVAGKDDAIIGEVSIYAHIGSTASLGYLITAAYEGKGITRDACRQLIAYAQKLWGLDALTLEIESDNERSEALATSLGAHLTDQTKLADHDTRTLHIWEMQL